MSTYVTQKGNTLEDLFHARRNLWILKSMLKAWWVQFTLTGQVGILVGDCIIREAVSFCGWQLENVFARGKRKVRVPQTALHGRLSPRSI